MKIEIIKDSNDPYARYTMPRVEITTEGKSTNTRTVITNLHLISQSLKRPPILLLKYISNIRGTSVDVKHDKFILRGNFTANDIQDMIYSFIEEYVLCPSCKNPETYFVIEKCVVMRCYACGEKNKLSRGKLYNMIEKDLNETRDSNYNDAEEHENYAVENEKNREDVILEMTREVKNCSELDRFVGVLKNDEYKILLGGLERNVVKRGDTEGIVEFVKYLIDNKIVKKIECFKYFQSKSKYVGKEDSVAIRSLMTVYFQQ